MKQTIANNIVRLRNGQGLTQLELGIALGYNEEFAQTRISQYETGQRSPNKSTMEKIAQIMHVPTETLFKEINSMVSEDPAHYGTVIEKIVLMLRDMESSSQREVLKYAEEKKLVSKILKKRTAG